MSRLVLTDEAKKALITALSKLGVSSPEDLINSYSRDDICLRCGCSTLRMRELEDKANTLAKDVAVCDGIIDALHEDIDDLKSSIEDLETEDKWKAKKINDLMSQLEAKDASIERLQAQLDIANFALTNAKDTIAMLQMGY